MLGLAGALLALGLHALAGFPTLAAANGDNDSLLRLVEIRDLIGGQAWFDLHQYRMGPPGGFVMHWSRLVDAPIAAIIVVVSALTGKPATGETVALFAWTTPLMAAALTFLLRIARSVYDEWAIMPAFIICTAALHFSGVFAPGDIDHHNVQLTLCLAAITALIAGRGYMAGIAAGAACALMLAVGMETLPYVAVAGMTAAATYLLGDRLEAAKAAGLGMGLAAGGLATFVATVPASSWLMPHCDAYSIPQFSVAATSGIGLAVAAVSPVLGRSFGTRLAALLALGIAVAAVAVTAFPQCLADPYAGLDPKLQQFWLNQVTEAQPFWRVLSGDWVKAAGSYVTPILALIVLGLRLRRHSNAAGWILMAFLTAAFVVSLWQVRGATFSLPLAAIALAGWVGDWRNRTASTSDRLPCCECRWSGWFPSMFPGARPPMQRRWPWERRRPRLRRRALASDLPITPSSLRSGRRPCLRSPTLGHRSLRARLTACWPGPITATSPATCSRSTRSPARPSRRGPRSRATGSDLSPSAAAMPKPRC